MAEPTNQLTAAETPLDPDLPICDPHHHLRERPNDRYFLEEFIQDTSTGHNVVATVCVENRAMYRKEGPEIMKPIGETEFFESVAAQAAGDPNQTTRVAVGIVASMLTTRSSVCLPLSSITNSAGLGSRLRCQTPRGELARDEGLDSFVGTVGLWTRVGDPAVLAALEYFQFTLSTGRPVGGGEFLLHSR